MSHSSGQVKFADGTIMFFEYNGTTDFATTRLHETAKGVSDNWRADNNAECTCGNDPEDVELCTIYGEGISWTGKACKHCKAIVSGLKPGHENGYDPYLSDWWVK